METSESNSSLRDTENIAPKIINDDHPAIRTLIEKQGLDNVHLAHVPVSWRGLSVSAPDAGPFNVVKKLPFPKEFGETRSRNLLEGFRGIVNPGEISLVLGRPGSGCSTFLRALANRTSLEEDQHIKALTVRQTLSLAPQMSLPSEVRHGAMVEELVQSMAQMFGIDQALDTPVGGSFYAVLAAGSSVQCFDNSTRGLDSSTALDFVKALHLLTMVGDRTTMATIYQAGETLYNYFNKVLVIYDGGQAFLGKIDEARPYFEDLGFMRAKAQTIAEFLSSVSDPAHREATPGSVAANMHTAADSAAAFELPALRQYTAKSTGTASFDRSYPLQLWECLLREIQLVRGQAIVHYGKWIATILLCLIIASEYFDVSADAQGAFSRGGSIPFALNNGIFVIVFYFLAGLQVEASKFFFFWFVLILSTICFSGLLQMFAYYVPTLDDCFRFGGTGSTITILFSAFLVTTNDMRPSFGRLHYLSPINYVYESVFVNGFDSLNFDCSGNMIPDMLCANPDHQICIVTGTKDGQVSIPGIQYAEANGLYLEHKWRNVGILFVFIAAYVIISMIGSELMQFTPQGGSPIVYAKKGQAQSKSHSDSRRGADGTVEKYIERELPGPCADTQKSCPTKYSSPSLTWKNLTIDLGEKHIIKGISAYIRPGDFVSICGTSGAGFAQQAVLRDLTATVREALEFSALLRQPDAYSRAERLTYVESVLNLLDLKHIADALIGDENSGLAVEMTKRVTIGAEHAPRPHVLLADEPTSGLDSEGAANIDEYLCKLSHAGQAAKHWRESPEAKAVLEGIDRINKDYKEGNNCVDEEIGHGELNASILVQSWLLTVRMLKNQWRNPPYMYSKTWVHVIRAILTSTTVYKLGTSPSDLQNREAHRHPSTYRIIEPGKHPTDMNGNKIRMLSVFSIVVLVNTIVNTVLAREYRSRDVRLSGMLFSMYCHLVLPCGLPNGEAAGYVFLSFLTEVFEVRFGLLMIGMSPDLGTAGNILVFLVCSVNWFNGIIVPYEQIQVFWWYWMYWINPFTYLLGSLVTAVIEDQRVVCRGEDLYFLPPPANETCGCYLSSWASSAQYTMGNQYLERFRLGGGENGGIWGD
ncbi:uncharacterized protein N7482_003189 [Penicillium canariense]|uniref:ABC transporter domain-containing protein n=1 Tax=Penicillium canariense TaxID=189055 RepID=A0A9W9I435_9EURO|nr:uncharacterized protein N7482_003189 [Penicillium canariense]KAJ5167595.1 hypothetical protein N7482_003189 [Penicillium canariense]